MMSEKLWCASMMSEKLWHELETVQSGLQGAATLQPRWLWSAISVRLGSDKKLSDGSETLQAARWDKGMNVAALQGARVLHLCIIGVPTCCLKRSSWHCWHF